MELLMAHNPDCHICERFINEVAIDYHESSVAKTIPLVIISVYEQPKWFKDARGFKKLESGLKKIGFSQIEVEGILGNNWYNFYKNI